MPHYRDGTEQITVVIIQTQMIEDLLIMMAQNKSPSL